MIYIKDEKNELDFNDLRKINKNVKVIEYPQLSKYTSMTQILPKHNDCCVLYFETVSQTQGHYQCMWRQNDTFHFWDSYGLRVSGDKSYIEKTTLIKLNEFQPYLPRIIDNDLRNGFQWFYNQIDYQSWKQNVATCGKWTSIRLKNRDMTEEQFYNYILNTMKTNNLQSFDETIVFITYPILKK